MIWLLGLLTMWALFILWLRLCQKPEYVERAILLAVLCLSALMLVGIFYAVLRSA
ncbi:hypothetical protein LCGC14_1953040 [marine sediment metagenome]|uniref:Uncharacterized protein n=1 Tax=marine sediment metagenome TaxID=412755 RepID=A0A0F9HV85_9ZZZZ